MKKKNQGISVLLLAGFMMGTVGLCAQDAWDRQQWGNHRAVVEVDNDAPVVRVRLPWRRRDDPAGKAVFVVDASSGKRVTRVYALAVDRESGDFIFEPATGKGTYYFYYMPYRTMGSWYFPNTVYEDARRAYDSAWETGLPRPARYPEATVLRFESVDAFDSFAPMEVVATRKEVDSVVAANKGAGFLVFPEDRKQPVRMEDNIPRCWIGWKEGGPFYGTALRNEFYVFQLGVYAAYKDMRSVTLAFSDMTGDNGAVIPAASMRCFNTGGRNWEGKPFTKTVGVRKGTVQSFWVGLDLGKDVRPGTYSGEVTIGADGLRPRRVSIRLRVQDSLAADRGYGDLFRLARLNWLDSDIGIDDSVFKPYSPVSLQGNSVHILGRTLWFDRYGLPQRITSTFQGCNASADGPEKDILAGAIRVRAISGGKTLDWRGDGPLIREKAGGAVRWTTRLEGGVARLDVAARMECDGYVNYELTLIAVKDMDLDDFQLQIPYASSVATYMMGLGHKGGKRPGHWDWKWEESKANNMVWVGDVNAGLQCKLKNETPDWAITDFGKTGPYKDWSNEGSGGATLSPDAVFTAYTGRRHVARGQVLHFNFGLLITPVKTLDPAHWDERYFQADPPIDNWRKIALAKGASVMNVHQGNVLNPYINYPFVAADTLRRYIAVNRALGIRTKVYYTVRELSNRAPELWPFRSLGDEIFTPGLGSQVADQFADDGTGGNLYCTGGSWLVEHLGTRYDAAWHTPLPGGDNDMAIRTQGLSRLHNYYVEGLNWLIRNTGTRGIYLDGVGYDREIMKRVRKVMDRAADSCLIDMHSGNNFFPTYGLNSPANQYMELFPFLNSLWLGEGYDYNESPDYLLVEVSGIPFGLYGEMLNGGGNAYRGMLYGMTNRLGWLGCDPSAIWRLWDVFGIRSSRMTGYWDPSCPVRSSRDDVKVTVYRQPGKVLIAYASWTNKDVNVRLDVDWKALGLEAGRVTIVAPAVAGLQEERVYDDLMNVQVGMGKGGWIIIQ
jgi:hypothetical protein